MTNEREHKIGSLIRNERKRIRTRYGFFFGKQQGSCITIAYNRVGVESVLSLSI